MAKTRTTTPKKLRCDWSKLKQAFDKAAHSVGRNGHYIVGDRIAEVHCAWAESLLLERTEDEIEVEFGAKYSPFARKSSQDESSGRWGPARNIRRTIMNGKENTRVSEPWLRGVVQILVDHSSAQTADAFFLDVVIADESLAVEGSDTRPRVLAADKQFDETFVNLEVNAPLPRKSNRAIRDNPDIEQTLELSGRLRLGTAPVSFIGEDMRIDAEVRARQVRIDFFRACEEGSDYAVVPNSQNPMMEEFGRSSHLENHIAGYLFPMGGTKSEASWYSLENIATVSGQFTGHETITIAVEEKRLRVVDVEVTSKAQDLPSIEPYSMESLMIGNLVKEILEHNIDGCKDRGGREYPVVASLAFMKEAEEFEGKSEAGDENDSPSD